MAKDISENDVYKIAALANLSLTQEEVKKYTKDFNSILSYMDKLNQIDVSQVEAMSHVQSLYGSLSTGGNEENVFRKDEVVPSMSLTDALRNAPSKNGPFFKTPLIKEGESEVES